MSFEGPVTVPEGHVHIGRQPYRFLGHDDRIGMIDVRDILG